MAKEQNFEHPPKGHVGLLAYDSVNNRWQVVHVDEDGQLHIEIKAELPAGTKNIGDVDVVTMPTTTVQAAGGDKIFALEDGVWISDANSNASTGTNTLETGGVPENKIWVITNAVAYDDDSAVDAVYLGIVHNGTWMPLDVVASPVVSGAAKIGSPVVLDYQDTVRADLTGCVLNDNIYLFATGYVMDAP